jgi:hypothetical protein
MIPLMSLSTNTMIELQQNTILTQQATMLSQAIISTSACQNHHPIEVDPVLPPNKKRCRMNHANCTKNEYDDVDSIASYTHSSPSTKKKRVRFHPNVMTRIIPSNPVHDVAVVALTMNIPFHHRNDIYCDEHDGVLPPPPLQRQVASCWLYLLPDSNQFPRLQCKWSQVVTQLPPTSSSDGTYLYNDKATKSNPNKRSRTGHCI